MPSKSKNSKASKKYFGWLVCFGFVFLFCTLRNAISTPEMPCPFIMFHLNEWQSKRRPNERVRRQAPQSQYLITMAMLFIKGCATTRVYPRVLNLRLRPFEILFQRVATKVHHFLLSLRPGVRVRQKCLLTSFSFSLLTVPYRCGIKKKRKRYKKKTCKGVNPKGKVKW